MTATTTRLAVSDGELEYQVRGQGRPVVFLHAGGLDMHMWDAETDLLAGTCRVVRYSARGHGDSSTPLRDFHAHDDLRHLLDHVGIDRATLVGVSHGARTALDLAVTHPDRVAAMLLVAPGVAGMEFTDPAPADLRDAQARAMERMDADAWVDAFLRMWIDTPYRTPEQVDAGVRRWIRDTLSTTVARHGTAPGGPIDIDPLDRFGAVRAPTLVVSGTLDSTDHRWIAGRIAAAIPGARTVDVEAAHMINLDAPDRFAAVLREFLHATAPKGSWDALPVRDWLRIEQAARVVPRYAPVEAGRLAYEVRGEGPPVVLLHGGMLDMHMWDAETALLERSHRVIRFDARGHGLSSTPDGDHRPAQDLRDLLDRLGAARRPVAGGQGRGRHGRHPSGARHGTPAGLPGHQRHDVRRSCAGRRKGRTRGRNRRTVTPTATSRGSCAWGSTGHGAGPTRSTRGCGTAASARPWRRSTGTATRRGRRSRPAPSIASARSAFRPASSSATSTRATSTTSPSASWRRRPTRRLRRSPERPTH
jgi:pimeloyl-ACP methyl ester carboxylesterase